MLLVVSALSSLIAAAALIVNARQIVLNNKIRRASIVTEIFQVFMDDDAMQDMFYKIEYDLFEYGDSFHSSVEERQLDKLLRHFSNLAVMWENKFIDTRDIQPVEYFILRITQNREVIKYLSFIEEWSADAGMTHPYFSLKNLSGKLSHN